MNDSWRARSFVTQCARNQSRDRVHNYRCTKLAAAEHVVADRDLAVGERFTHSLIYALVAPADQDDSFEGREFLRDRLIETPALRRKQDNNLL